MKDLDKLAHPAQVPHPTYPRHPRDGWRTLMRHQMVAGLGLAVGILVLLIAWALWEYDPNRNRADFAWVTGTLLTGVGTLVLFSVYIVTVWLVRWYKYG